MYKEFYTRRLGSFQKGVANLLCIPIVIKCHETHSKWNYSSHESLDKTLSFLCECGLSLVVSVKQWKYIHVYFWPNALLRSAKQQPEIWLTLRDNEWPTQKYKTSENKQIDKWSLSSEDISIRCKNVYFFAITQDWLTEVNRNGIHNSLCCNVTFLSDLILYTWIGLWKVGISKCSLQSFCGGLSVETHQHPLAGWLFDWYQFHSRENLVIVLTTGKICY